MIELITSKNKWDSLMAKSDAYDFYCTYDYHALSVKSHEKAVLIKYTENDVFIGLPLLIREIRNTPFFDATSVYGYAGPVSKNITARFNNEKFRTELYDFFDKNHVIAVFSRLNPYLPHQNIILNNIGEIKPKGDVVMIDLGESLEDQRRRYQKRIKSHINKARKLCTVTRASSEKEINDFINLYYENMRRVDAKSSYFFSEDYFYKFEQIDNCQIEILLATLKGTNKVISGAMFVKTKDIIQYHLSGTHSDHLQTAPLKLLIDEMRIEGTKEKYKVFNLGGGLNSKDDSLLRFKKSFSKTLKKFSVWQYVVNQEVYDNLVNTTQYDNLEFFPRYRRPE